MTVGLVPMTEPIDSIGRFLLILLLSFLIMDQRYVDTVRAVKVILNNLDHLDAEVTYGQRAELERLLRRLQSELIQFLEGGADEGLWIGEE